MNWPGQSLCFLRAGLLFILLCCTPFLLGPQQTRSPKQCWCDASHRLRRWPNTKPAMVQSVSVQYIVFGIGFVKVGCILLLFFFFTRKQSVLGWLTFYVPLNNGNIRFRSILPNFLYNSICWFILQDQHIFRQQNFVFTTFSTNFLRQIVLWRQTIFHISTNPPPQLSKVASLI